MYFLVEYKRVHNISDISMEGKRKYLSSVFSYLTKHKKIKETEFYKQNTEVARANAESNANIAKANAEFNSNIAKANSEASIASSNALVAFFTTVSVEALTTLALKKPELFENNAQPQNPETSPNPSLPFDSDERAKPVK